MEEIVICMGASITMYIMWINTYIHDILSMYTGLLLRALIVIITIVIAIIIIATMTFHDSFSLLFEKFHPAFVVFCLCPQFRKVGADAKVL